MFSNRLVYSKCSVKVSYYHKTVKLLAWYLGPQWKLVSRPTILNYWGKMKQHEVITSHIWVHILISLLTSYVTLDKLLSMSLWFSSLNQITMPISQGSYEDKIRGSTQENVSFDGDICLRSCQKPQIHAQCSWVWWNKHVLNSHCGQVLQQYILKIQRWISHSPPSRNFKSREGDT